MPEKRNGRTIFTLLEVTKSIQKTIADRYKNSYWIKAEMNQLNFYPQSGHCYPELVEKSNGKIIAQIKCNLWKDDYQRINSTFQRVLGEPLRDGIKILFLATIGFHPEYGLTLRIVDIDPSFTLGDLEREKQETIKKLQEEGIFRRNKSLNLPMLPQRIAIISVQTSKGYADFLKVFESANNSWGYKFFHYLFPTLLQGDRAVQSICNQLSMIKKVQSHFDVVAIVRGGGGEIGLSCYNDYNLAKEIALFPLPVITGIGHATNETIVEMLAFENAITPTKSAEFLIQKFHNFSVPVQKAEEKIIDKSKKLINEEKTKFQTELKLFRSLTANILVKSRSDLREQMQSLLYQSRFLFKNERRFLASLNEQIKTSAINFYDSEKQALIRFGTSMKKDAVSQINQGRTLVAQTIQQITSGSKMIFKSRNVELSSAQKNIANMDPKNVLKRGYSITFLNGKAIKSIVEVKRGDNLTSRIYDGNILSTVRSSTKSKEP